MKIESAIKSYISSLIVQNYPAELVNRRHFTYQRFLDQHNEFSFENLLSFYKNNNLLAKENQVLLHIDILCLIRYLEQQRLIDTGLFRRLDCSILI